MLGAHLASFEAGIDQSSIQVRGFRAAPRGGEQAREHQPKLR
jgi:hypothetical protein